MRRIAPIFAVVLALVIVSACDRARTPIAIPGAGDATLPRGAIRAIEARWPQAELGTSRSATCPSATGAPSTMITGDFNGDGSNDAVLWISTPAGPRLVAVFARLNSEYTAVDLGDEAAAFNGTIDVGRRGTPYQPVTMPMRLHFGVDTVVLSACDGAQAAYFWTGDTFHSERLSK